MAMVILLAAIAAAAPAAVGPTYLTCELAREEGGPLAVDVAVDEANQQVTIALPSTGRVVTRRALFSPTEVTVPDQPVTWRVSRVDLTFGRKFDFMPAGDVGETGRCQLKAAPAKRAF
jgi:hypothetical protein